MTTHRLKTDRAHFITTILWQKPFELRFDDRNFQVGDTLILEETEHSAAEMAAGAPLAFTGRRVEAEVVSKLKGHTGLEPGWCVLGLRFLCGFALKSQYNEDQDGIWYVPAADMEVIDDAS